MAQWRTAAAPKTVAQEQAHHDAALEHRVLGWRRWNCGSTELHNKAAGLDSRSRCDDEFRSKTNKQSWAEIAALSLARWASSAVFPRSNRNGMDLRGSVDGWSQLICSSARRRIWTGGGSLKVTAPAAALIAAQWQRTNKQSGGGVENAPQRSLEQLRALGWREHAAASVTGRCSDSAPGCGVTQEELGTVTTIRDGADGRIDGAAGIGLIILQLARRIEAVRARWHSSRIFSRRLINVGGITSVRACTHAQRIGQMELEIRKRKRKWRRGFGGPKRR